MSEMLLDRAGRRRSPATMPGFHAGRPPRNKGLRYPADPPKVEEIASVMREAGNELHGRRLRGLTVSSGAPDCRSRKRWRSPKPIWITGAARCSCVAERADAAARSAWTRGAGMSSSHGSNYESSSRSARCSVSSTAGRVVASGRAPPPEASCDAQPSQRGSADASPPTSSGRPRRRNGSRGRAARGHPAPTRPQQPRHHIRVYLRGIDNAEIIETVHARRAPMIPVTRSPRR